MAGNCIQLLQGFHANAIGATVPTTFHARLGTVPDFSLTLSCPQNMQFGVQSNCSVTALPSGGFNQNIYNLTMSITPTSGGWSVYPIPGLAPPNWSSPIQITPQSGPSGWYYLQISGTSAGGAIQHTAVSDVYVTQTPAPLTITPTSLPGGQTGNGVLPEPVCLRRHSAVYVVAVLEIAAAGSDVLGRDD